MIVFAMYLRVKIVVQLYQFAYTTVYN